MKIRKNIWPRRFIDILCFLLIGVFLPIVFIFEMIVVLPAFHEPGGFFHTFTLLMAIFLVFNIKGNMLGCMMIDTNVEFNNLKIPKSAASNNWRYCEQCKGLAPPRTWHCRICCACILKRDHHCLFTGCCIGHNNHRFFLMFIFYLFIGASYAFIYNSLYLWVLKAHLYRNWLSILKMTCPLLMLVTGSAWHNMYLVFYNLNILAVVYSIVLLVYHFPTVLRGSVCFERSKGDLYNYGWRANLKIIFGERMSVAWLSPLIRSRLNHNGIDWKVQNETFIIKKNKENHEKLS